MRMRELRRTQPSFADLELWQQVRLDPLLRQISAFLDQRGEVLTAVHRDLRRQRKDQRSGRAGMNAEQVLRSFVLMRLKNWDYRELAERVADGYTLRQFTRFHCAAVPRHHAFHRAFVQLTVETLRRINQAVVAVAVTMGLEDVHKLRMDTTVVETDIRYPRDSGLLWDTVRVLSRLVDRIEELAPESGQGFPRRTRRAKRRMQEIGRMRERAQRPRTLARKDRDLIRVTTEVIEKAAAVANCARLVQLEEPLRALLLEALCDEVVHFCELGRRVIDQSARRVFGGETVPATEKLYSIFEPHTDLIKRGKAYQPVEFGHKVLLVESRIGLITDYRVLDANPVDSDQLLASVQRHIKRFGKAPRVLAADRGFHDAVGCEKVLRSGVGLVAIPQRGGKRSVDQERFEKSRAFKQAQAFRSGVEGRISVLFRGRGMKRCLWSGSKRFELFIAAAVLANNLLVIAGRLQKRKKKAAPLRAAA
jgi:transposase, IS5 family